MKKKNKNGFLFRLTNRKPSYRVIAINEKTHEIIQVGTAQSREEGIQLKEGLENSSQYRFYLLQNSTALVQL